MTNDSDRIVYMRVPQPILEVVDTTVAIGLYANRAEVLRELLRNGMKSLLYHDRGGFCQDLKKMVDCCHDDHCKYHKNCKIYSE
jgi:hypothetical protein